MEHQIKIQVRVAVAQVELEQLLQRLWAVDVQRFGAAIQVHGTDQSRQAQVMIAVQMRNEDVVNALKLQPVATQLQLRTLSAIDQQVLVVQVQQLSGIAPAQCGCRRTTSEYGQFKSHQKKTTPRRGS